ncbi:MAG: hypothetical protein U5K84_10530 [Alkalibacterium sp.]|nr:hypothetical protein [Alkalibacterium sp.]
MRGSKSIRLLVTLSLAADFKENTDTCQFYYKSEDGYQKLGPAHQLAFKLDHFTGCRFGLFNYGHSDRRGQCPVQHVQVYNIPQLKFTGK